MSTNKSAPAGTGIPTGAEAEKPSEHFDSNIKKNQCQLNNLPKIADLLLRGEANAIRTVDLVALSGLKDARTLRSRIETERANGAIILSTVRHGGGYFLPSEGLQGRKEIEQFIRTVHARAINSQRTLKTARRALHEIIGQLQLSEISEDVK